MNQIYVRKLHKTIGIVLVFFIFLQAGSGLFLSFSVSHSHAHTDAVTMPDKHENGHNVMSEEKTAISEKDKIVVRKTEPVAHNHADGTVEQEGMLQVVHHGGGFIGSIYRIFLASGFLFMAFSGSLIFYLTRKAMRQ
jgi:hypothetical protein